jgi:hypothetical protein
MSHVTFSPQFYRGAAVASVISAATTLLLIFLPSFYGAGEGLEARMLRVRDPAYQIRAWVAFIHPFLAMYAAIGVAVRLRGKSAGLALLGGIGFLIWGVIEMTQQALTLVAFDPWRTAWLAGDPKVRMEMPERVAIYDGIWDALYLALLTGIILGSACFGRLFWQSDTLSRTVGTFYGLAALLSVYFFFTSVGVREFLPEKLVFWFYPLTQPLARTLIGVWLWRHADEERDRGCRQPGVDGYMNSG